MQRYDVTASCWRWHDLRMVEQREEGSLSWKEGAPPLDTWAKLPQSRLWLGASVYILFPGHACTLQVCVGKAEDAAGGCVMRPRPCQAGMARL